MSYIMHIKALRGVKKINTSDKNLSTQAAKMNGVNAAEAAAWRVSGKQTAAGGDKENRVSLSECS